MKKILPLILFLLSMLTISAWIPKLVPKPEISINKAMGVVLAYSKARHAKKTKQELSQFYISSIQYKEIQINTSTDAKDIKSVKKIWGWQVEILRRSDLTKTDELFLDNKGNILNYISWT